MINRKSMKAMAIGLCTAGSIFIAAVSGTQAAEKPEIFVQMGHSEGISSVAVSPDGTQALSAGWDTTLKLWDIATGREIRTFIGHSAVVNSVAVSPDGRLALSGSGDKTIRLWDIATGKEIKMFAGHAGAVYSVAFSPDGRQILTGNEEKVLKLWDAATGKEIRTFTGHAGEVYCVAVSPDGRQALSGSFDKTMKLWDIATGREIRTFTGFSNWVLSIAFSPDGRQILTGNEDKTLKLWDIGTGREIRSFAGLSHAVHAVAFSPDGRQALATGYDQTLKLWDVASGREIKSFIGGPSGWAHAVAVSPDGRQALAGGDNHTLKLWDIATGREIRTFTGYRNSVHSVAVSPDGTQVITGSDDHVLKLWDVANGRKIRSFSGPSHAVPSYEWAHGTAVSPDGRQALSGWFDKTLKLWDISTGKAIRTFSGHTSAVTSAAFSPDGRQALSGNYDYTMKLWDVATGREIRTFTGHTWPVWSLAVSRDGRLALSGSGDKTVRLWDIATGREIRSFRGHAKDVYSVALSPDGRQALSGSFDKTVKLWDVANGREIRTFTGHADWVISVALSPDGTQALSAGYDHALKLWDVATGREIRSFRGHAGAGPKAVAFTPDGRFAVSGGDDTTTRIWDLRTGREVAQFNSFADGEWVVITPEGYFNASRNGPAHLNVRQGNKVFGLDQFYDVFYRPDIVEAKLRGEDIAALASANLEEALKNPPPTVEFIHVPARTADSKVTIQYRITSNSGGGIGEVRLFHNGKLVQSDGFYRQAKTAPADKTTLLAYNARAIKDDLRSVALVAKQEDRLSPVESAPKGDVYEGTIAIDAVSGENDVGLAAFNRNNSVQSILKTATFESTLKPDEPRIYILSIGIDEYKAAENNLKYAVKDAESIVRKLREQSGTQYKPGNIHVGTIKNGEATKTNILNRIQEISGAIKPNDVFVLFIAGHGVLQSGLYSIVTHDYNGNLGTDNLINSNEIMEISKNMKALTQIFILDTCHAGGLDNFVSGLYDARMTVMARNMGLHMFASASSTQEAMDGYKGKNGMFTYTLLAGLDNNRSADENRDGKVSIYELGSYAKEQTIRYSKETGHAQTPVVNNFGKDLSVYVIR